MAVPSTFAGDAERQPVPDDHHPRGARCVPPLVLAAAPPSPGERRRDRAHAAALVALHRARL